MIIRFTTSTLKAVWLFQNQPLRKLFQYIVGFDLDERLDCRPFRYFLFMPMVAYLLESDSEYILLTRKMRADSHFFYFSTAEIGVDIPPNLHSPHALTPSFHALNHFYAISHIYKFDYS
jgi:hypothetical protein